MPNGGLGPNPYEERKPPEEELKVPPVTERPPEEPEVLPREWLKGIEHTINPPSLPAGYGQPATVTIMPDWEYVGTTPTLRSDDFWIYYQGKRVGKVAADTGELSMDDPGFWWKAWVPSLMDRLYLSETGQVPREAFSKTPLKVSQQVGEWLYTPKQIGKTTIPSPATILSAVGLIGIGVITGGAAISQLNLLLQAKLPAVARRIPFIAPRGVPKPTRAELAQWAKLETRAGKLAAEQMKAVLKANPQLAARATPATVSQITKGMSDILKAGPQFGQTRAPLYGLTGAFPGEALGSPYSISLARSYAQFALEWAMPAKAPAVITLLTNAGYTAEAISKMSIEIAWGSLVNNLGIVGAATSLLNAYEPTAVAPPTVPPVKPSIPEVPAVPEVETITVYHATIEKNIVGIQREGLKTPEGVMPARWFMVTDSLEGAREFATGENPRIIRYEIPRTEADKYLINKTYSEIYGNQYGLGQTLPSGYIAEIATPEAMIEPKPPAVEVAKPPVEPIVPLVEGVPEALATQAQKAQAHIIAHDKALVDPETGKARIQYRRLAQNITGKKSMVDMTSDEASAFIEALEKYPERKWSAKAGKWIPQAMPITKAIVPENYFALEFKEPTPVRLFTSQNFYATKLGVGELTRPLELAKQKLDLEYPAWTKAVELKIKELNKVYKVTAAEKLVAIRNNVPTRAVREMAELLNKYEDPPAELSEDKAKLFMWFRNVDRTILAGENRVRELLDMPLIPYRRAYLRHIADETAREIMQGNYSLPQDLAYWSKRIVGKRIFNPMAIQRKLSDDLLEHFTKDLLYATKSMIWTGLKEIHLSQPLRAFTSQLNVLSKGMMPFSSLTSEEIARAQAVSVLPASTRKWVTDYVNVIIKGQQTELDASINRAFAGGLDAVFGKFLNYFGRSVGTRPVTKMAQFSGRLIISATIGTKPRQIIRNLWQRTQNLALYGIEPTLKAHLPADKTLSRLLDNSMFLKSYARYEELPPTAMGKVERAWLWLYGKSAISNARNGMKAAYHGTIDYITNPKNKGLGWADPARTYTEPEGFLYPSEEEKLLREMEFGAGCTQYQYIAMGMPEVFRHKVLIPFTRLQSWWMNYFAKFNREAIHRFWTGSVGWDKNLKLPPKARLNWIKYVILGGALLTALGYKRSFMKGVLPAFGGYYWGAPASQFATAVYGYIEADTDWEREKAKKVMYSSMRAFAPGAIDYKSWQDVWTGEKPMSSLFFYGEDWPIDMPTWGIPPLEEEAEIKHAIEYANEEIARVKGQLGKLIPAEDDVEEYTYEMSDYASDIRGGIRGIPPERITKENGFSDIALMYKKAEVLWDTHYYSLPASARQEWLQQDTPESIWTGAYLALWGKLKVTGWVSGNPQTIALIRQLVEEYNIPPEAIPSLGELEKREAKPEAPPVTPPPTPPREEGLGPNPYE